MAGEGLFSGIPVGVLTDSYKSGHFQMYPEAKKMVAYGEFRKGYGGKDGFHDPWDKRLVVYGIRYIVENFLHKKWTMADVDLCQKFYSQHMAPAATPYPFPEELFRKFVEENDGYFPVKVEALPEGSVVTIHVPIYQITAEEPYAHLCTFLETLLTQIWYPSTVATLSRRCKDLVNHAFEKTVDESQYFLKNSRLHDFGFRGCCSTEQSVLGGCAHLLNFDGTDTMSAAYYAQFVLNDGKPVGSSIPATEHSVMTAWPTEKDAIRNMAEKYGEGLFAVVMDAYDYMDALAKVVPVGLEVKQEGGHLVIRPDSGCPIEAIIQALRALERLCEEDAARVEKGEEAKYKVKMHVNSKGKKVFEGAGAIQGDGIGYEMIKKILDAVGDNGYAASNVGFGMGGGLLQKVNRDTMSFATKLSYIHIQDEEQGRNVMKAPKTDVYKISLPGILQVQRVNGIPMVSCVPENGHGTPLPPEENMLKVVYNKRPLDTKPWDSFEVIRARVEKEWAELAPNKGADPISEELKEAIKDISPTHYEGLFKTSLDTPPEPTWDSPLDVEQKKHQVTKNTVADLEKKLKEMTEAKEKLEKNKADLEAEVADKKRQLKQLNVQLDEKKIEEGNCAHVSKFCNIS